MRILVLAPAYHPLIGGAESYIRTVATGLAARGHDVMVATDGDRLDAPVDDTDGQAAVRRLLAYRNLLDDPTKLRWEQMQFSTAGELAALVDGWGTPDVVFANSHETAVLGSMVALTYGRPLVANFHEQEPERGPLGRGRARLVYAALPVNALVAGSRFYHEKALAYGSPPATTHHIPHGIECERFATEGPRRPDGRFVIALSGRIAPRKQQDFMVRVLARLISGGLDAHLVVAGRAHSSDLGYYERLLALVKELDLEDRVTLRQDLALDDMPGVYRECDVVVQPSLAEGLGLAVLEAMAAGRPTVVSDVSGLREVIGDPHVGLRLSPHAEGAWAEALTRLAADEELRARLVANALSTVRREFNVRRMLDQTERLLEGVRASWSPDGSDPVG
ncbi:glycosyltransferase family 4 protein [Streptomyces zaomyceticus]|uniref:glycosyltransferase family 4 protein n=1 Tax=Streptomyces zaomyceticus TaxID=68286 RepID=UPI00167761F9|nr:glycosyltransferase family 4 protein [Streptomyces zaomyceticus]GHG38215.1 glycosyl transferase family 1 [Streptomyces zaomyceticus]